MARSEVPFPPRPFLDETTLSVFRRDHELRLTLASWPAEGFRIAPSVLCRPSLFQAFIAGDKGQMLEQAWAG